jgi:HSP20 family protein
MLWNDVLRRADWEPFAELNRFQREMNRLFGDFNGNGDRQVFPPLNIYTGKENVLVTAELPGVDPQAIDISILGNALTLSGVRQAQELKEGEVCHRAERTQGEFQRTVELPVKVNPDKVEASYAQGILRVTLPRSEEDKPKLVKVKI